MASPRPVKVRCPGCDEQVTVTPRVVGVHLDSGRLHVTFDSPSSRHACPTDRARTPTGFAPANRPEGGSK